MNDATTGSPQGSGVTLANWRQAPWNAWAFHHIPEILPVMRIAHDPAQVSALPKAAARARRSRLHGAGRRALDARAATAAKPRPTGSWCCTRGASRSSGTATAFPPAIRTSCSRSASRSPAFSPASWRSAGSSIPTRRSLRYIPEAAGSVYGDCTVRHVLDMNVGIAFVEDYLDTTGDFARYRAATGWNPVDNPALSSDLRSFLVTLRRDANPHGAKFHYVSPNSDLLGWILERAGGMPYARMLTELIWQKLGAEADAHVTVDRCRRRARRRRHLRDAARPGALRRDGAELRSRRPTPDRAAQMDRGHPQQRRSTPMAGDRDSGDVSARTAAIAASGTSSATTAAPIAPSASMANGSTSTRRLRW